MRIHVDMPCRSDGITFESSYGENAHVLEKNKRSVVLVAVGLCTLKVSVSSSSYVGNSWKLMNIAGWSRKYFDCDHNNSHHLGMCKSHGAKAGKKLAPNTFHRRVIVV